MRTKPSTELNGPLEEGTRQRLLTAAVELFAERGYESTAVREIVSRAGVSKPLLYYYFGSKDGILRAIIDHAAEEQADMIAQVRALRGTVRERLYLLFSSLSGWAVRNHALIQVLMGLFFAPGGPMADHMAGMRRGMMSMVREILLDGTPDEVRPDLDWEAASELLISALDTVIYRVLYERAGAAREIERMLTMVFQGLAPGGKR